MESRDADEEEQADKLDAKTVRSMIADALDSHDKRHQADSARLAKVNADAATILPSGYTFGDWVQTCLDAIVRADPEAETRAKGLAARARKGDSVAEGMLRNMLHERRGAPEGGLQLAPGGKPRTDSNSNPWDSNAMPAHEVKQ